jgi:uncharacterized membrane protein YobD (UPF0266 family)
MAIVATVSKYKIKTYLIWIVALIALAAYCIYDGYFNQAFRDKHVIDGKPDVTMVANRKAPIYIGVIVVMLGGYALFIRSRKIVADDNALVIDGKVTIPYDSVQTIDKTDFDKKGHFTFTYKTPDGKEIARKISDRDYDNLKPILDHLVAKIS